MRNIVVLIKIIVFLQTTNSRDSENCILTVTKTQEESGYYKL